MTELWRKKLIAFSIHIIFSATIIGIFMIIVTQLWFPDILFELENVWEGLQILIPVDAILGPILTLVLFVPGKKGLLGDIIIIAIIQVLALAYGGHNIYSQRPAVMVFAGDRFEIIPAHKFDSEKLQMEYFEGVDVEKYPLIVYALPAQTLEEKNEFVLGNVQYQKMVERYRPVIDYKNEVSKRGLDLTKFAPEKTASQQQLMKLKEQYNNNEVLFYTLEGTTAEARILVLDSRTLKLRGYLDIDPWS